MLGHLDEAGTFEGSIVAASDRGDGVQREQSGESGALAPVQTRMNLIELEGPPAIPDIQEPFRTKYHPAVECPTRA